MNKLHCQKNLFSLPHDVHYLNCATMSPNLLAVEKAGIQGVLRKTAPFQITQETFFQEKPLVKTLFAQLVNAGDPERCALIPSVSYGMATVAKNLAKNNINIKGKEILLLENEFPSDVYPWQEVVKEKGAIIKTVKAPKDLHERGKIWNQTLLDAITPQTCLVITPHCHWTDGTKFDLATLSKKTKDVGALLVVDGTQSVGAMPFDLQQTPVDALVCAGYKTMMGPYSLGLAYYGPYFDDGVPIEENWINRVGSEQFRTLTNYQERRPKAYPYNVGETSNFILMPMLLAALRQLIEWNPARIQEYLADLVASPLRQLQDNGFWVETPAFRGNHLFGLTAPAGIDIASLQQKLIARKIYVSLRNDSIRVAPSVYNDQADMSALVQTLLSSL